RGWRSRRGQARRAVHLRPRRAPRPRRRRPARGGAHRRVAATRRHSGRAVTTASSRDPGLTGEPRPAGEAGQAGLEAGARVALPNGDALASFPEMATSFALGELLQGRLALVRVVIEEPVLHLVRDASGMMTARVGADDSATPDLGPQLLRELAAPRQNDAMLGLLRRLSVRGATVVVDDQPSGRSWRAERVDIAIERGAKGVSGDFALAVPIGAGMPEVHASYRYLAERQLLDLEISIDAVQPADIPP